MIFLMNKDFENYLSSGQEKIELWLEEFLPPYPLTEGGAATEAARYSLLGSGKRIRPIMLVKTAKLYGVAEKIYKPFAVAIEMIHSYSLIHDDLPAMDDDDLRRRQPSCHKKFGEAIAILAGDLLLNTAFEIMLESIFEDEKNNEGQVKAALALAKAAGRKGMIAGQCLDLHYMCEQIEKDELILLQKKKTGELLAAALLAGAYLGAADQREIELWQELGFALGLIFQMTDDLLDFTSAEEVLGKSIGKDLRDQKSTFATVYGLESTREMIFAKTKEAELTIEKLKERGKKMDFFDCLNRYLPRRLK